MTNENAINVLRHLSPPRTSKAAFDAFRQAIIMAIEALSSSEPRWHPVSEMPEEDDDYLLLTYEYFKYGRFPRIIIGAWDGGEKVWLEYYEGMYRYVEHPVAWISQEELLLLKGYEVTE